MILTTRAVTRLAAVVIASCTLPIVPAFAQEAGETPDTVAAPAPAPAAVPAELRSPYDTLRTFVTAMNAGDRGGATACLDLSLVEEDGAADRAQELYRVINRIEFIDFEDDPSILAVTEETIGDAANWTFFPRALPRSDFGYRIRFRPKEQRFRRVSQIAPDAKLVLSRGADGAWRFSAATVQSSREVWEQLKAADLPIVDEFEGEESLVLWERLEVMWPSALVEHEFLRIKYWQWITLFVLIMLGLLLDFTVRGVLTGISVRAIRRRDGAARRETIQRTVRPFGLTAAALFWLAVIRLLGLPDEALKIVVPAVRLFAMLAMVWSGFRLADLLSEVAASKAAATDTRFDDVLIPLARKAIKVFIFVFGLIYIADSLDVPIAPLITGLGIGGAGFAFAAKDTLEHLFGSVTVITDRPFEIGDWVEIDGTEGTVEQLGFRSTRIRTFYNSLVTVPNGNLVRAVIDNYGKRKYRRFSTHLNITYDTPPERIDAFCEGLREIIRLHPYTRKDYYMVWLHKLGPHSIDILMYMFFEAPDWGTELRERHRLLMDILRLAKQLGVEFAFPTQTLHVARHGGEPAPADAAPDADSDRRARAVGRRALRALVANADWREEKPPPFAFDDIDDETGETQIESKIGGSA